MTQSGAKIDLQMLQCLEALVTERSVTRASEAIGISQPAMSTMLAKLREQLDDPLLIRTSHGMVPTPKALDLAKRIGPHVRELQAALAPQVFAPFVAEGTIRLAMTDTNGLLALPGLRACIEREAPRVSLVMRHPNFRHIREWLEEGECDIAIVNVTEVSKDLLESLLYTDPMCCIVGTRNSGIGDKLTLEQYAAAAHVTAHSQFPGIPSGDEMVNRVLAERGLERVIGAQTPSTLLCAYLVAESNMIATMSLRLARHLQGQLPIRIHEPPFKVPDLHISQVWHKRTDAIGLYRWARRTIQQVLAPHEQE